MAVSMTELVDAASVIPVLTVGEVAHAAPLAKALKAGGLRVIEMTWRTEAALDVLKAMKSAEPDLIVGMGTIRSPQQAQASIDAGADFLVSPGLTPSLTAFLPTCGIPVLPGHTRVLESSLRRFSDEASNGYIGPAYIMLRLTNS